MTTPASFQVSLDEVGGLVGWSIGQVSFGYEPGLKFGGQIKCASALSPSWAEVDITQRGLLVEEEQLQSVAESYYS